jgi:hypothetical protein
MNGAARLMDELAGCLKRDGGAVVELDATAPVELNAERLFKAVVGETQTNQVLARP